MSKRTDVNKANSSFECIICHWLYFFKIDFRFQPKVFDGCHNLMQKGIRLNDAAIVSLKGNNYRNHFWCMSKCEAINIMKNSDLTEK